MQKQGVLCSSENGILLDQLDHYLNHFQTFFGGVINLRSTKLLGRITFLDKAF